MGVHISRVKSVDLDTWTDEQMASMLRWGNARANRYWEAKLAPGHVPNESKIENFIRTKYDSKRWVMDGPMPDPATLDDEGADDDVPLNVVQEKAKIERNTNGNRAGLAQPPRAPAIDLFGDATDSTAPVRPNTTEPASSRAPAAKTSVTSSRQTKPGESLLGFDFLGGAQSAPPRPASAVSATSSTGGRMDLKNSILSLYASAPKPAATSPPQSNTQDLFGQPAATVTSNSTALGDLGDAFGGLSFSNTSTTAAGGPKSAPPQASTAQARQPNALSGGSFFETKPVPPPKPVSPPMKQNDGFGDFGSFSSPPSVPSSTRKTTAANDLFDLSTPAPAPAPTSKPPPISASNYTSAAAAFNLSQPKATPAPVQSQTQSTSFASMNNVDAWGSDDAWGTPDPAPATAAPAQTSTSTIKANAAPPVVSTSSGGWADTGGWGEPDATPVKPVTTPGATSGAGFTVQRDEDFGGWSHASPVSATSSAKPAALGGNTDDLFGNVWS